MPATQKTTLPESGIFLLDKPAGISSAKAIEAAKQALHWKKVGHGGTLDPFASGLLVVMVGDATKVARFLLQGEKEYIATARLGMQTDTDDLEGEVVAELPVPILSKEDWQSKAEGMMGRQMQTPPSFSAIKIEGKPAYAYARRGIALELEPREIFIRELEILSCQGAELNFRVVCSGGTYVRVLARDLAGAAKTTAHLTGLRRTKAGLFSIEHAATLEQVQSDKHFVPKMVPFTRALAHLPTVECNDDQIIKVRHGNLAVFQELRGAITKPGYFLIVSRGLPIAIANHNPQLNPFCSLERVFDPTAPAT